MNYLTVLQYIPRNMHTVFALLCFVVFIHWLIVQYPSGLLHWHGGNLTIAPVPAKQPWWIWIHTSCELIMNDCITTTKQSTTKTCAYYLRYTVFDGGYYGATIKHGKFFWSDDTKEKLKPLMETETQRVLISIVIVPSPCYIVRICESHPIVFLMGKSWSWYHMAISFLWYFIHVCTYSQCHYSEPHRHYFLQFQMLLMRVCSRNGLDTMGGSAIFWIYYSRMKKRFHDVVIWIQIQWHFKATVVHC